MVNSDEYPLPEPISAIREIRFPAIHDGRRATILALLQQLRESEQWSPDQILAHQMDQLGVLIAHAAQTSPFYRQRFNKAEFPFDESPTPERIETLPVLTRRQLQRSLPEILSDAVPPSHGETTEILTSGSTGSPVTVKDTALAGLFWNAITLRDHLWHRRDYGGTLAAIRWRPDKSGMAPEGTRHEDWGAPVNLFFRTGRGHFLNSASDIGAQVAWLEEINPTYLITHPSNLAALAERFLTERKHLTRLREVRTVGETVTAPLRAACKRAWGVSLTDFYTCQEAGYLALQCPESGHYHIQSEHVYLEIVDREGRSCKPGEIGRVLVTSLHNFATPLIRYEVGDFAEMGDICACGRGLPVLRRVLGRVRHMLTLPSGEKRWPNFGFGQFQKIADIRQFQVVQRTREEIEFRVVTPARFTPETEAEICRILVEHLGYPFRIEITYHRRLARSRSGKFEDFVSLAESDP